MFRRRWLQRLEALGHWFFYAAIRLFGHVGGIVLLFFVISVYWLFSRHIRRTMSHYLKRRFTDENSFYITFHGFRNLFQFGRVLVERGWLGVKKNARLQGEFEGYDELVELINRGQGLILITAHVGNWQSALAHLENLPVRVNALMQYDQQAAAKHFFDLGEGRKRPFDIIDVEQPFGGMIDAMAALQRGEVVTIMGDRYTKGSYSKVEFLGDPVRFPDGAYLLGATSEAPVAVIFAAKTGMNKYKLKLWDSFYPEYGEKQERATMLHNGCLRFSKALEAYLQQYPYQWYNFYNFWQQ